ncbi:unnamed protein product [Lasius platythorax]|uniref:DDE Tnp4 domain-containing protein n=1 Tax=Lasius platythorax TaxID=488582 RepID=A0AAV2NZR6_9HYME
MSTPDFYRSVCEKFGIGKATAFRAVRRVTYALYCLAPRVIQWPKHQHAIEVMNNFEKISGFPNVIGAIDGSHIRIRAPKIDSVSYINRKGDFPNDSHIIGDAAYPIHPHVMVPFRDNGFLTIPENNYNYCLSSTRMVIERAFGLLKMRFRMLLDCVPLLGIKHIAEFIIACCVLHHICMSKGDIMNNVLMHRCNERIGPFYENNSILGNEKEKEL